MEGASGKAAPRQVAINAAKAKGQGCGPARPTLQLGNLEPEFCKPMLSPGIHEPVPMPILLTMFLLCSHAQVSQMHAAVVVDFGEKGVAPEDR